MASDSFPLTTRRSSHVRVRVATRPRACDARSTSHAANDRSGKELSYSPRTTHHTRACRVTCDSIVAIASEFKSHRALLLQVPSRGVASWITTDEARRSPGDAYDCIHSMQAAAMRSCEIDRCFERMESQIAR